MNTLTGWQKVVILAIMMAAIPLTFAFVAPAAGAVTGIATTLLGTLFVNFNKPEVTPELVSALASAVAASLSPKVDPAAPPPSDQKAGK